MRRPSPQARRRRSPDRHIRCRRTPRSAYAECTPSRPRVGALLRCPQLPREGNPVSLSGLLTAALADPALAAATDSTGVADLTLSGPPGLQPFVIAAAARADGLVLAVTSSGREAEDLVEALRCLVGAGRGRALPGVGDAAARAAQPPRRHRRPAAGRAAPPRPPVDPRSGRRPAEGRRRAGARAAAAAGAAAGRARPGRAAAGDDGRELTDIVTDLVDAGYARVGTRSRSAATSPCAAASSTSSRRPRTTRCAWSSGATRSRRSATSRSPTSARSRSPRTGCGRRRAANCCSPTRCRRGRKELLGRAPRARRAARPDQPRRGGRGHGGARARPRRRPGAWCCTSCPPARTCWCATPSGCAPGRPTSSAPARSSSTRPGPRPPAVARRRSISVPRRCAISPTPRPTRAQLGIPWWSVTALSRSRRRGQRLPAGAVPTAVTPRRRWPT